MTEKINPKTESESKKEQIFEDVVFVGRELSGGKTEYKSSAIWRKVMILAESSKVKPKGKSPYRVKVVGDSNPGDLNRGAYTVEIIGDIKQENTVKNLLKQADDFLKLNDTASARAIMDKIQFEVLELFPTLEKAREVFREDFIGMSEIEQFLGVGLSNPMILRSLEESWEKKAKRLKLTREKLEQLKKDGFMMVLRQPHFLDKNGNVVDFTVKNILDDEKCYLIWRANGEALNSNFSSDFVDKDRPMLEYAIVKKAPLVKSYDRSWLEQSDILKESAEKNGFKDFRRRSIVETIYDCLAYHHARNIWLLKNEGDLTASDIPGVISDRVKIGIKWTSGKEFQLASFAIYNPSQGHGVCPQL